MELELAWLLLLVIIHTIMSEYFGCFVTPENVFFKHIYFEEQRTALKTPEGVIFDPRVPVLELFLQFIMLEEFLDHITSQSRRQFKLGITCSSV